MDEQFEQQQGSFEGQNEPGNLEEAWARMRGIGDNGAQVPVQPEVSEQEGSSDARPEQKPVENDVPSGGSAGIVQPSDGDRSQTVDYNDRIKQFATALTQQADKDVREEFEKQGIRHLEVSQYYEREIGRDGQPTGRIVFKNPDDPNGPRISRMECQQIVDAWNKQIDYEIDRNVRERQRKYIDENISTFRMYEFAPSYNQMESNAQEIFNMLIKDYAVVRNGKTIGWNCDLKQMSAIAKSIAGKYQGSATQPQAVQQPTTPAVDAPSGSTNTTPEKEPQSLEEAMMMLRKNKSK